MSLTKQLIKYKFQAMGIHFLISLGIFFILALWLIFWLYPQIHLTMSGGIQGLWLMFMIDVVLGPILTLMIYNPRKSKREKILDFSSIGFVQLSALIYGLWTVFQEHPRLIMMYDMGTAVPFTYRDTVEDPDLATLKDITTQWHGLPVVYLSPNFNTDKIDYIDLAKVDSKRLLELDKIVRHSLNEEEKKELAELEKQHGSLWIFAMMGKYRGAYFVLNKNFEIIAKIGEKPVTG